MSRQRNYKRIRRKYNRQIMALRMENAALRQRVDHLLRRPAWYDIPGLIKWKMEARNHG